MKSVTVNRTELQVKADGGGVWELSLEKLKAALVKKAAALGGDAVILVVQKRNDTVVMPIGTMWVPVSGESPAMSGKVIVFSRTDNAVVQPAQVVERRSAETATPASGRNVVWTPQVVDHGRAPGSPTQTGDTEVAGLHARAEQGNVGAQLILGARYANGSGVPRDYERAVAWFRKAADQGSALAQCRLGAMYATGQGVVQDNTQAMAWYRRAADQGNTEAQTALAKMPRGSGVTEADLDAAAVGQAVTLQPATRAAETPLADLRTLAEQGDATSQYGLGVLFADGRGVLQDDVQAHKWLNLAASRAPSDKQAGYAKARDTIAARMTPEQRAEAQRLAREWTEAFDLRREKK